jgi:flagellar secretion chaperone FliS
MNPYLEQTILNADPIELIGLVYRRAISSVRDARVHLEQKRIAKRSAAIVRAYLALGELLASLRPEAAPELTKRLCGLYVYMQQRLLDANMQQADRPLAEVLGLLITLEEGWTGVAVQLATKKEVLAEQEEIFREENTQKWYQPGHGNAGNEATSRVAVSA